MSKHDASAEHIMFDEKTLVELVALLNQSLADTLDLAYQTKHAHWNVKGYNCQGLHLLFGDLHSQLTRHVDEFAERAVTLGGQAMATIRIAGSTSQLEEYPLSALDSKLHVDALVQRYIEYLSRLHQAVQIAERLGDPETVDLYTSVSRAMDKALGMLVAHQQA